MTNETSSEIIAFLYISEGPDPIHLGIYLVIIYHYWISNGILAEHIKSKGEIQISIDFRKIITRCNFLSDPVNRIFGYINEEQQVSSNFLCNCAPGYIVPTPGGIVLWQVVNCRWRANNTDLWYDCVTVIMTTGLAINTYDLLYLSRWHIFYWEELAEQHYTSGLNRYCNNVKT